MKENLVTALCNLIKVKTIVTFAVVTVFVILALTNRIDPGEVMIIVSSVISFYFGTQHEKKLQLNQNKHN